MTTLNQLVNYADQYLKIREFKDYCPNGLQVEGRSQVNKIATAVTANFESIEAAAQWGADVLLVHHGYFWKGEASVITGIKKNRLKKLLDEDLSLVAYHLPLDAHPEVGNNVQLGHRLGFTDPQPLHKGLKNSIGNVVTLSEPMSIAALLRRCEEQFQRAPLHIDGGQSQVQRVAWCTGAAQNMIDEAIQARADVYISGEISEQTVHIARESGIHFISAGHHATEKYGVQALAAHLAQQFSLQHCFFDIDNPV